MRGLGLDGWQATEKPESYAVEHPKGWTELTVGGQRKNQLLREAEQHCGVVGPPFKFA